MTKTRKRLPIRGGVYLENPKIRSTTLHKEKGWTSSITGYWHESSKLARLILRNRKYLNQPYTWAVTIKIESVMRPDMAVELWRNACEKMRDAGVTALWVREPAKNHSIHYHLITTSHSGQKKQLERAIEKAMPHRSVVAYHKQVKPILSEWYWSHYITKAKVAGTVNGVALRDKYAKKRLLFRPHLGLNKSGKFGDFWAKRKKDLWAEIQSIEQRITDGLANRKVRMLAEHVYALLGSTVSRNRIERSIGFSANHRSVTQWIAGIESKTHVLPSDFSDITKSLIAPVAKLETKKLKRNPSTAGSIAPRSIWPLRWVGSLFRSARLDNRMRGSFKNFVTKTEGLFLPKRPPLKGMPRINTLPCTNARRAKLFGTRPKKPPSPAPPVITPPAASKVQRWPRWPRRRPQAKPPLFQIGPRSSPAKKTAISRH
jgi:hypothetical protein